jgi:CheY-like chemotaxis protein
MTNNVQSKPVILLVDDDEILRETLCDVLETEDFQVIQAVDGLDGLKKYKEFSAKIHRIITDIRMPNMNGAELVREIRKENRGIPILVVSGEAGQVNLKTLVDETNVQFIQKPFKIDTLLNILTSETTVSHKAIAC